MIKLGRYILIIVLSCLLLACASARMAEEVQSGKATFNTGNFKQAFAQLLPLAVKGSCEAQYAVGYMYYYGLGVEAHKESAVFWLKQSAAQMYRPAIKAMKMLEKNFKPCDGCEVPARKSSKQRYSENDLAEKLLEPEIQNKIAAIKKENKPHEDLVRMAAKATPQNKEDDILMSLPKPPQKVESQQKPLPNGRGSDKIDSQPSRDRQGAVISLKNTEKNKKASDPQAIKVVKAEVKKEIKVEPIKEVKKEELKVVKAEGKKETKVEPIKKTKKEEPIKVVKVSAKKIEPIKEAKKAAKKETKKEASKITKIVKTEPKKQAKPALIKEVKKKDLEVKSIKVASVDKDKFTLQLFGSYDLVDVKKLQEKLKLKDNTHAALTKNNGRDWYVLAYGKYPAVSKAVLAKSDMPTNAQKLHPWVRNTDELHWVV